MSETNKNCSNETVKQMIGSLTAEMQNNGQYVPLTFTPAPQLPGTDNLNWNQPSQCTNHYNLHNSDNQMGYPTMEQFHHQPPPVPFNYIQQQQQPPPHHMFNSNVFINKTNYDLYHRNIENGTTTTSADLDDYHRLLLAQNLLQQQQAHNSVHHERCLIPNQEPHPTTNHTHIIDNLVGNWVVPNTSGTYSPFGGDSTPFKPDNMRNMFNNEQQMIDEAKIRLTTATTELDDKCFQFNNSRSNLKKPRMVAEVKPMRPSYSDVLTKPVPQNIVTKSSLKIGDLKENNNVNNNNKMKKDNTNSKKSNKQQKINSPLNRSNTNNDITKELLINEKNNTQFVNNINNKVNDKVNKTGKSTLNHQLNRKWASLDNITEPLNDNKIDEVKKKRNNDDLIQNRNIIQKSNYNRKVNNKSNNNSLDNTITSTTITQNVSNNNNNNSKTATDAINLNKNGLKKANNKVNGRQKQFESFGNNSNNERPPGKRNQRVRRRENQLTYGLIKQKFKQYLNEWWKILSRFLLWLLHLISDICSLSIHISRDYAIISWSWLCIHWVLFLETSITILKRIRIFTWIFEKFTNNSNNNNPNNNNNNNNSKRDETLKDNRTFIHSGLQNNLDMPTTGEEAMRRLLACKGKDPYSILGVSPNCSDDDIKRYYKRQAFLVHPDKNQQPGAEEAFKILVHAFDMIGEPERRAAYDKGIVESVQVDQAWSELSDLIAQLQQKVTTAANTIRCSACGLRHKRVKIDRPSYAARNCATCKIHHSAREGDIWAEARCFGFLWNYYACMEGGVYDITEWAGCQKDSLKQLRPDTHQVQYRIALGKQNNQTRRHSGSPRTERPPDLENLLNSLYGQADSSQHGTRRRNKKANNK